MTARAAAVSMPDGQHAFDVGCGEIRGGYCDAARGREPCGGARVRARRFDRRGARLGGSTRTAFLESACLEVRAQVRHALVPIIALAPEVNELAFAEAFSCGGDDVVGLRASEALTSRLRRLPLSPWERPAPSADKGALISASDRDRRIVLARVLGNAGYPIRFAVDLDETDRVAREASPRLVVIDTALDGVQALVTRCAPRNPNTLWIVSTAPRHMRQCHAWLRDLANATVTDSFAPPENIVFLANELGRGKGNDKRASRRLLYGTKVAFRCAGREDDDYGLSYNVSAGGLSSMGRSRVFLPR